MVNNNNKNSTGIDFLAIGDIVIDDFIRLKNAHIHSKIDTDARELCVTFGDKIPYESLDIINAVGNSPNAAVSASRLGLSSALITNIGDDLNGKECLNTLKKENVDESFIKIEEDKITNCHFVLLYGVERTILIKHTEFNYEIPENLPEVKWIYLSSLAEHSLPFHKKISEWLIKHPETKLAFQPGTFQMKFGVEELKDIYAKTEIFFCNLEEAERILKIQTTDVKTLLDGLHKIGPKIVCISDGPNGAYASDGQSIWLTPMYPDIAPPLDRTGAGDAFSSTFITAIALGKTIPEALSWGPINSMSVVQYIGAQTGLLSRNKLEEYLTNKPESYKISNIWIKRN